MKNFSFIFLLILSTTLISIANAQNVDSLGWKGKPIIPVTDFVNPAKWHANSSAGDACSLTKDSTDDRAIVLHWKFGTASGHKYAQIYFIFDEPISLSDLDIVGIDIKGQHINNDCGNFDVQLKFENSISSSNATCKFTNLARLNRWCENISKIRSQFNAQTFQWDQVKVVSLEIFTDQVLSSPIEGEICFRNLSYSSFSTWKRATEFEKLNNISTELNQIKKVALDTICNRQTDNGLLITWREDGSSWLYGQGLALKILSQNGSWKNGSADSVKYGTAATKLATFLVNNQDTMGFWPRAWRAKTGKVIVNLEDDGSIWFGDFPWIIIGLQNYFRQSGDSTVLPSIEKARHFLTDSLIDPNGKLYTLKKQSRNFRKVPVTSVEAYSSVILSLLEIGEKDKAVALASYIDSLTWNDSLRYWKEGIYSTRVVLFGNAWFSDLISNNPCIAEAVDPTLQKSKDALTLAGKVLYTKGAGRPIGFDGIGPVATWLEGSFSYICAGGPGSQMVFDSIIQSIEPGYGVLHYNDDVSCNIGDIWAVKWLSLDGTSWLYYAASKSSPFHVDDSLIVHPDDVIRNPNLSFSVYPNPTSNLLTIEVPFFEEESVISVLNISGKELIRNEIKRFKTEIDVTNLPTGIFYVKVIDKNSTLTQKFVKR
jgi:hypothetical protein